MRPMQSHERLLSIDIIRGIALLGIFMVNIISFHSPVLYMNPFEWWDQRSDLGSYVSDDIFIEGSFYPIFAFLFGFGMVMIQQRTRSMGDSSFKISARRLLILLGFGIIHAVFIWYGDILIIYALLGLLLLTVLSMTGKKLVLFGMTLFLIPNLLFSVYLSYSAIIDPYSAVIWSDINGIKDSISAYTSSSYAAIMQQRIFDWYHVNNPGNLIFMLVTIFPMMMIGAGAAKEKWFENAKNYKKYWVAAAAVFLTVGILLKMLPYILLKNTVFMFIQNILGGPMLGIGYLALLVLLTMIPHSQKLLKPFAMAGRMSLTIYISQSIVGSFIFYGYGLNLYNDMDLSTSIELAIGIYFIQVIAAEIWFIKFKQGPLESIWKKAAYRSK
ncbi:DUF418 domain-containing protein [Falsibacillus albus]|uniref:DUF418 domain-containing protein n=1 Tax=Falsibacillus albus TaxID=2478915 RepID=A0A3L7K4P2_9BACI|nr:DUF418 domain-containing protein [Falsibacillus albus]RLQ97239.1 DUF418 domain-containing protein [Falsibacillus albus]